LNRERALAAVAIAAVAVLAWDLLRSRPAPPPEPAAAAAAPGSAAANSAPAKAVPGSPAEVGRAPNFLRPASVSKATGSPLSREFSAALSYKPLYDRLKGTAEGETPEGQYILYRILRACATIADRKGGPQARAPNTAQLEERRQQIAESLPEGDPRRAQRLEAFDKVTADQCAGLAGITISEGELGQLLKNALAGNDPKARAWQVEQEMWQERRAANLPGRSGPTLSDAQIASVRDALSSRDPEAIAIAGRLLANPFRDLTVRIGPDREPIEGRAFANAALLLACEYGYPCGENNTRVLSACAYQGHCGVSSLPDYLFYYGASPYDAQLLDRYRGVLRQAVDTGDWSGLAIDRATRPSPAPPAPGPAQPAGR
jgi:hypothetical protein